MRLICFLLIFLTLQTHLTCQWSNLYGTDLFDICFAIELTDDGYFIGALFTSSTIMVPRWVSILKTDQRGKIIWFKAFKEGEWDMPFQIIKTKDGGALFTASIRHSGWVCKFSSEGNIEWQKSFWNYLGNSSFYGVETKDGYFLVLQTSTGPFDSDLIFLMLDKKGNLLWQKSLGTFYMEGIASIVKDRDESFIVTGYTTYNNYRKDVMVIKFDSFGNTVWQIKFGGEEDDEGKGIISTDDGYILCASTRSYGVGSSDIWIVKLNKYGKIIWQKTVGTSEDDIPYSITKNNNGKFFVVGNTFNRADYNYDGIIIKGTENGEIEWVSIYGREKRDTFYSAKVDEDDHLIVGGDSNSFERTPNSDIWLSRFDSEGKLKRSCNFFKNTSTQINETNATPEKIFMERKEIEVIENTTDYQPKSIKLSVIHLCEGRIPDNTFYLPKKDNH